MKKLNAFGQMVNRSRHELKPNIKGRITQENINYTEDDLQHLAPINVPIEDPSITMIKQNRNPETELPERLPTNDLPFYPIDEHNAIGSFESKQNIYLILAYAYNQLQDRCDKLEERIKQLEK